MNPIRFSLLPVSLLLLSALAAFASPSEPPLHVRFDWASAGLPAQVDLPLPAEVEIGEVQRVSLPDGGQVAGFAVEAGPPVLRLYPAPVDGEELTFSALELRLMSDRSVRYEFGRATVVGLDTSEEPLSFERSMTASGAGLYGAVALRNTGDEVVMLQAARYLPASLKEGQLLVGHGDPVLLLSELEEAMSPASRREAAREGVAYPPLQNFAALPAGDLDLRLAPRESVVLAWTDASLPKLPDSTTYELSPFIEYRVGASAELRRLGLNMVMRKYP